MKNLHVVGFVISAIQMFPFPSEEAAARTYTTSFPRAENPISEGGNWVNGKTDGLVWADVATTNGIAIGLQSGQNGYDDATALLTGTWGSNQTGIATVHATNQQAGNVYEEVEIRLRSVIAARLNQGYEINFSLRNNSSAYCQIVRWNGPLGDFTYIASDSGPQFILHEGDEVKATISGTTISAYINGTKLVEGKDGTFSSGNPGIGFYVEGTTGVNNDYGFTSFTASDGVVPGKGPTLSILPGGESNGTVRLIGVGDPGQSYTFQFTDDAWKSNWQPIGAANSDKLGVFMYSDSPPAGTRNRFYRATTP